MPRGNRLLLLAGLTAGLAILGLSIWYGSLVYGKFRKPNHSIGLSECSYLGSSYLEDIRAGRPANAYHSMSTAYRSRLTLVQYSAFLNEYLLLNTHTFARQGEVFGSADSPDKPLHAVRIRYTLLPAKLPTDDDPNEPMTADPKTNRRKLDVSLHFVQENGKWVVDQITFP